MARLSFGEPVAEVYIQLAAACLMLDRYEEALAIARKAMAAGATPKEHVHIYAHCEIIAGSLDAAMAALSALLETTPDYTPALFLTGVVLCLMGKEEPAQEIFQPLRERGVDIAGALDKLSGHLAAQGRKDRAEQLAAALAR
jgi:tetratricopeptide (TPR) repeat protein